MTAARITRTSAEGSASDEAPSDRGEPKGRRGGHSNGSASDEVPSDLGEPKGRRGGHQ